jgi:ABC-2 type transport system permease protein
MLRLENARWWLTSRWWVQSLAMLLALNGFLAFGLWTGQVAEPGELPAQFVPGALDAWLMWMSILTVLDVLFVVQGAVIAEKQSGIAAWILSGPVSRVAYLLAKFVGNAIGLLCTAVVLQGAVAYAQLSLRVGQALPVIPIAFALSLQALYVLFYLALALMLGVFFSSRVPVLAISFAVLLGQPFVAVLAQSSAPWLSWALPARLPELARYAHRGEPLPSVVAIVVVLIMAIGFLLVAIWRFTREEF